VLIYDGLGALGVVGVFMNFSVCQFIFLLIVAIAFALLLLGSAIVGLVLLLLAICIPLLLLPFFVWHCCLAYACH